MTWISCLATYGTIQNHRLPILEGHFYIFTFLSIFEGVLGLETVQSRNKVKFYYVADMAVGRRPTQLFQELTAREEADIPMRNDADYQVRGQEASQRTQKYCFFSPLNTFYNRKPAKHVETIT